MDGAPLSRFENPKNPQKKKRKVVAVPFVVFFFVFVFPRYVFCFVLLDSSSCWTVEVTVYTIVTLLSVLATCRESVKRSSHRKRLTIILVDALWTTINAAVSAGCFECL